MNILAFFAHPDDETMLAGGALALLAQSGAQVHFLCATRGEGGEVGEPPACALDELGDVREQEMVCAVRTLGGRSLTFLGHTDPRVGPDDTLYPYTEDLVLLAGQVAATIRQLQADVLLTHGSNGEYGHPAHINSHLAARVAVESLGDQAPLLYTAAAFFPEHPRPRLTNQNDPAHLVIDVSLALPQKTEAARCHRTQHALFTRRASEEAGRLLNVPEVILSLEGYHRHLPPVEGTPNDHFAQALQLWQVKRET
jgi:LmbE family N-acetylglucosaminyl deacetylase